MDILVTGATGLLGAATILKLAEQHHVIALVRNKDLYKDSSNVTYLGCDLSQSLNFEKFPTKIDAVIHLAQSLLYRDFPNSALDVFEINTAKTAVLLDYALRAGAKIFLYASSGSVYEPYQNKLQEDCLPSPTSFYATSKFMAEQLMWPYQSHLAVCAFRLFFLYGLIESNSLVSTLVKRVQQSQPIILDGNEGLICTPTHVDDVARLIQRAVEKEWNGIFNVASPETISIRQLGMELGLLFNREPVFERSGKDLAPIIIPSLEKLKRYYPEMDFLRIKDGLQGLFI